VVGGVGDVFGECRLNETKRRWWLVLNRLLESSWSIPHTVVGVVFSRAVKMWSRPAYPEPGLLN